MNIMPRYSTTPAGGMLKVGGGWRPGRKDATTHRAVGAHPGEQGSRPPRSYPGKGGIPGVGESWGRVDMYAGRPRRYGMANPNLTDQVSKAPGTLNPQTGACECPVCEIPAWLVIVAAVGVVGGGFALLMRK